MILIMNISQHTQSHTHEYYYRINKPNKMDDTQMTHTPVQASDQSIQVRFSENYLHIIE